jgi:hypothetical protein
LTKVYQKDDLEILIATMNRSDLSFLKSMFPNHELEKLNLLIVNQTSNELLLTSDIKNIKVFNSFEKGLSKSRNLALKNSRKDLLIITDDDVIFKTNFENEVVNAFNKLQLDVITFQIESIENQLFRKYSNEFKLKLNWFEILGTHSVEMVLKRKVIEEKQLQFDEKFGLGANFSSGEEAIFMAQAKRKYLKIGYFPAPIVIHKNSTSTLKASKKEQYYNEGAVFYVIFGKLYSFWIVLKLFFDLKQNQISYKDCISLFSSAKKGKNDYAKHHN